MQPAINRVLQLQNKAHYTKAMFFSFAHNILHLNLIISF